MRTTAAISQGREAVRLRRLVVLNAAAAAALGTIGPGRRGAELGAKSRPRAARARGWFVAMLIISLSNVVLVNGATASGPYLSATDAAVVGQSLGLQGGGFPARTWVQMTWDGSASAMPRIRSGRDGTFSTSIVPPTSGTHVIGAIASTTKRGPKKVVAVTQVSAFLTVNVLAAPSPSPTPMPTPTATPTPTPTPSQSPTSTMPPSSGFGFHYGVLSQAGLVGDFTNFIAGVRQYGMNDAFIYSDNPDLSVSDSLGFWVLTSPMYRMYRDWYFYEQYHSGAPLCGGTITMTCAETQIGPIVDALKSHPSLVGYDTIDDANDSWRVRIWWANQVFNAHDTAHPEGPTVPGYWESVFDYTHPPVSIHYDYPARSGYSPCDFYVGQSLNWVDRTRLTEQPQKMQPLVEILQTHGNIPGLRYPTVEELRLNYWQALGEGAKGLYWFTWLTNTNSADNEPWLGLKDNTTLLPEATALVARMNVLAPTLAPLVKIADAFQATSTGGEAYISTLKNPSTGKLYVIAANAQCSGQTLTFSSWSYAGQLRDVETGQTYTLPFSLPFRGGDGKLFEVVGPTALTTPAPQNVAVNGSFENGASWPDGWSGVYWSANGTATLDSAVAYRGSKSVRVTGGTGYFDQSIALKPNTRYYLAFWVKGSGFSDGRIGMRYVDQSQSPTTRLDVFWKQVGTFDWEKHVGFFKTGSSPSGERLDVRFELNSGAVAWVDGVVLCEEGKPCQDAYLSEPR